MSLRAGVVAVAVESEKLRHGVYTVEDEEFPAKGSSREAQSPRGMTHVMLAVPKRALAPLPASGFSDHVRRRPIVHLGIGLTLDPMSRLAIDVS